MANVGALAANLHEGSRSEYLAQYIFASFGHCYRCAASRGPWYRSFAGIDLYCTMTERVGQLAWPRHHYTVQVKSAMSPWNFDSSESVRWLSSTDGSLKKVYCGEFASAQSGGLLQQHVV